MTTDYSYIGAGKIYVRVKGSSAPRRDVGNCSALSISVDEEVKTQRNYQKAGGGNISRVARITGVKASVTLNSLSAENLALATFGESSAVLAGSVTNEASVGYLGGFTPAAYTIDTDSTVTVKAKNGRTAGTRANSTAYTVGQYLVPAAPNEYFYKVTTAGTSASSAPTFSTTLGDTTTDGTAVLTNMGKVTLVKTTDYVLSGGGIFINSDAEFTDGQDVELNYTKAAGYIMEALLNAQQEYELFFDGLNEAQSGKSSTIEIFKAPFSPAKTLSLLGDDFASVQLDMELLADTSKNGTTLSQYFKARIQS